MKKRQYILLCALPLIMAAGCKSHNEDFEPQPNPGDSENGTQHPMLLSVSLDDARSSTPAKDLFTSFALVGWKDLSSGREYVFCRDTGGNDPYIANFNEPVWEYADISYTGGIQYLKYWDLSAQSYTFAAYAPVSGAPAGQTASFANGVLSISGLTANLSDAATYHWYEALYQRLNTPANLDLLAAEPSPTATGAMTDVVPLKFHQVLSKMVFKIYNTEGIELKVNSFKVTLKDEAKLYTKGDYTYPNTFSYDNNTRIAQICNESYTTLYMGPNLNEASLLHSVSVIPQNLVGIKADIELNYGDNNTINTTIDLGTPQNNYQWGKDRIYNYILALSVSNNVIMVNLETTPWTWADDVEEKETNW